MTIYRGYTVEKSDAGYSFKNEDGFFSQYYKTEDEALDAIDAMHRARLKSETGSDLR